MAQKNELSVEIGGRKFFAGWLLLNTALLFIVIFAKEFIPIQIIGVASGLFAFVFGFAGVIMPSMVAGKIGQAGLNNFRVGQKNENV